MAANDPLLGNAESFWNMLDEMAESDPEGYKTFMDKMLKDNRDWIKPPEAVFCLRTVQLPESHNHHIFLNICKWDKVPEPKAENEQISVISNNLRALPDTISHHSVMDLCFHPTLLEQHSSVVNCQKLISSMSLDYVESQMKLNLSRDYKILAIKYKGDVHDLRKFLFRPSGAHTAGPVQTEAASILENLSNITVKDTAMSQNLNSASQRLEEDLNVFTAKASKQVLIQEVHTKRQENGKDLPVYKMDVVEGEGGRHRCIVVTVDLPQVQTGTECKLDVSERDLVLCSPSNADLVLSLPEKGDEEETTSTFNKATRKLSIKIPII